MGQSHAGSQQERPIQQVACVREAQWRVEGQDVLIVGILEQNSERGDGDARPASPPSCHQDCNQETKGHCQIGREPPKKGGTLAQAELSQGQIPQDPGGNDENRGQGRKSETGTVGSVAGGLGTHSQDRSTRLMELPTTTQRCHPFRSHRRTPCPASMDRSADPS